MLDGRAHEREVVGQHGRHRQIAQRLLAHADGVHGRAQRLDASRVVASSGPSPMRPVSMPSETTHHRAQIAPGVARAQVAQRLADAGGVGGGRLAQRRGASRARRSRRTCRGRPRGPPAATPRAAAPRARSSVAARSARDGPPSGGRTSIEREPSTSTRDAVGHPRDLAQLERRLQRRRPGTRARPPCAAAAATTRGRAAPRPATAPTAPPPAPPPRSAARRRRGPGAPSRPARCASR